MEKSAASSGSARHSLLLQGIATKDQKTSGQGTTQRSGEMQQSARQRQQRQVREGERSSGVIDYSVSAHAKPVRKKRKNRVRSKRTRSIHRMKLDLDAIARAEVFERDGGKCIRCRNSDRAVQWAHVLSRRHLCLRWESDNAMTLCAGCHMYWHHEPAMAVDWFVKTYTDRWNRIKNVLLANPKISVRDLWEQRVQE